MIATIVDAAKQLSPVEYMKDSLAKAELLNPKIHAFVRFTPEIALAQAPAATLPQAGGECRCGAGGAVAMADRHRTLPAGIRQARPAGTAPQP